MNNTPFQNNADNNTYITAPQPFATGGMGVLYKAKKLHSDQYTEFLKTWDSQNSNAPAYSGRNKTESQILDQLHQLFSQYHHRDCPIPFLGKCYVGERYIGFLTPYIQAKTLHDLTEELHQSYDPEEAEERRFNLCMRLVELIVQIHDYGFLHRDIKPDNFLLEGTYDDFRIYIIDFGLAKDLKSRVVQESSAKTTFNTGPAGTPGYAPLEQFISLAHSDTFQSDLFSLAMVIFEILNHGNNPFQHELEEGDWYEILNGNFEQSLKHHPLFDRYPELQECLCTALSRDKSHRYPSTKDFQQAFAHGIEQIQAQKQVKSIIPTLVSNGKIILWNQLPDGSAFPEEGNTCSPFYDIRNDAIFGRNPVPISTMIQPISTSGRSQNAQIVQISPRTPVHLDTFSLRDGDAIDISPKELQHTYLSRYIYKAPKRNHVIIDEEYKMYGHNCVEFTGFYSWFQTQVEAYIITTNMGHRIVKRLRLRVHPKRYRIRGNLYYKFDVEPYYLYDSPEFFVLFDGRTRNIISIYKCSCDANGPYLFCVYKPRQRNHLTIPKGALQQIIVQGTHQRKKLWPFHEVTHTFVKQLFQKLNSMLPRSSSIRMSTDWKKWIAAHRLIQLLKEKHPKTQTEAHFKVLFHNMSHHLLHKKHVDILPLKRAGEVGFVQTVLSQNTLQYNSKAGIKFRFEYTKDLDFPTFRQQQKERISGAKKPLAEVFYMQNRTLYHIVLHESDQLSCGQWSNMEGQKNHFPLLFSTLTPYSIFYLQQNSEDFLTEIETDLISYPQKMRSNPLIKAEIFDPMFARFCQQCQIHLRVNEKSCPVCIKKSSIAPSHTTLNLRRKHDEDFGSSISIEENHATLYSFQVCSSWVDLYNKEIFLFIKDRNVHIQSMQEPITVNESSLPKGVSRMISSGNVKYKGTTYRIIIH